MIYILPWIISILQGYFLLSVLIPEPVRPRMPLFIFWSSLTGMATTAVLTFTSLCFFNALIPAYCIGLNVAATAALWFSARRNTISYPFSKEKWDTLDITGLLIIILFHIPVILQAIAYPDGGWDAWSCWNLKAKFLFLGGSDWRHMLDPVLWRSNISYPFLLPLINVWYWCFGAEPSAAVTIATTCRITFLMSGLLFFGLKETGVKWHSLLAPLWLLSSMFFVTLASSQYSDLLVGLWLLSTLLAFTLFRERRAPHYLTLATLSLGFMSFTKSEGLVLALICCGIIGLSILCSSESRKSLRKAWLMPLIALVVSFIPTAIFQICWAPDSHTFVNGLTSTEKPATLERLQAAIVYLGIELASPKWNGFWFIFLGGIISAGLNAWRKGRWVIPAIIACYMTSVMGVYFINTFFPIIWWLSTTLNRILFAMMPALVFWLFLSLKK